MMAGSHGRISNEPVAFDRTARTAALVSAGNFLANSGHSCSTPAATVSDDCLDAHAMSSGQGVFNQAGQDVASLSTHLGQCRPGTTKPICTCVLCQLAHRHKAAAPQLQSCIVDAGGRVVPQAPVDLGPQVQEPARDRRALCSNSWPRSGDSQCIRRMSAVQSRTLRCSLQGFDAHRSVLTSFGRYSYGPPTKRWSSCQVKQLDEVNMH